MNNINHALSALKENPCEKNLWNCVIAFQGYTFKTITGLPFSYTIKTGRSSNLTKELWIDRRERSKSLSWSSVLLVYRNIKEIGAVVERPKALGDIRGVSYIYGMFCRFGLIRMPVKNTSTKNTAYGEHSGLKSGVLFAKKYNVMVKAL